MFNSRHPQHHHEQQQPATPPPKSEHDEHEHEQHHGAVVVEDTEALELDKDLKQLKQALVGGLGVAAGGAAAVKQLLLQQHHQLHHQQAAASSTSSTFFTRTPHPHPHQRMDEEEEEEEEKSEEGAAAHQPPVVVVGNEHLRDHLYTQLRTSNSNNSNRADEEIKEEEEERDKQQQHHQQQLANNHHHDFHQLSMLLDEAAEEGISQFPPLGEASVAAIAQNLLSSLQHPPAHPHPPHEETLVHPHLSHHHQQQHHEGRGGEEEEEAATNALLQEQHEQGPQVSHHLSHFPPLGVQPVDFRSALELNRQFQAVLKEQLRNIEEARHRNQELQKRLRSVIAQNKKSGAIANAAAAAAAGGGRKGAAGVLAPPAIFGSRIGPHKKGTSYFTTSDGMTPPDNQDAIRRRRLLEKVQSTLKAKKWSKQELNQLRQGIRQANQQIMFNRLMELYHMGQKTVEMFNCETEIIRNLSAEELEKNTEGIEWENISKNFVPSRSAIDCKIQWLQNQHPSINKRSFTKQEDKRLLELAKKYKGHDWETIARELGTNRTPVQCFKRYQRSLNTNMMRSKWTEEENKTLVEAVKRYGEKNWQQVANCLEGRTGQQCLHRWQKTLNPEIRRGRWTAHEDMLLTLAVKAYGHKNWIKIQSHVPGRTDVQCRERWMNVLNPGVNNGPWTNEEDEKLREAIAQHGLGKWSQVAQMMPMRTDNQCWRRWKTLNSQDLVHYKRVIFKKKKGMVSNFVGREKERPELTPDDFEIEEGEEREGAMGEGAVVGGGEEEEGAEQLQQQQQEQMTAVLIGDEEEHGHHQQQQELVVIEPEHEEREALME
ncbi:Transcription factor MYB3R-1 [Balamuthia mandrillaris]